MDQEHEEIWHVQLPTGEVRVFTLDQLDAAFQVGMIDEGSYVRRDGAMQWRKLGEELSASDDTAQPTAAQPAPSVTPSPVVTYQPIYSTAPMVSEIDDDELPASFRPKSNKRIVAIVGGIAAIAAIGILGVTKLGGSAQDAAAAAGAAVNVTPTPVAAPPPADPGPAAQASKLNEDQKKALSDMDKSNERKAEQRRKSRVDNTPAPSKPYKSEKPFTKGGSKYDPLNAKL